MKEDFYPPVLVLTYLIIVPTSTGSASPSRYLFAFSRWSRGPKRIPYRNGASQHPPSQGLPSSTIYPCPFPAVTVLSSGLTRHRRMLVRLRCMHRCLSVGDAVPELTPLALTSPPSHNIVWTCIRIYVAEKETTAGEERTVTEMRFDT